MDTLLWGLVFLGMILMFVVGAILIVRMVEHGQTVRVQEHEKTVRQGMDNAFQLEVSKLHADGMPVLDSGKQRELSEVTFTIPGSTTTNGGRQGKYHDV
jgi:hypothetical protein